MDTAEVASIVNDLDFFPGWRFNTEIFGNTVYVSIAYPSFETTPGSRYHQADTFYTDWPINPAEHDNRDSVMRAILGFIGQINEHESREALRDKSRELVAPFHPHRWDGNMLWRKMVNHS